MSLGHFMRPLAFSLMWRAFMLVAMVRCKSSRRITSRWSPLAASGLSSSTLPGVATAKYRRPSAHDEWTFWSNPHPCLIRVLILLRHTRTSHPHGLRPPKSFRGGSTSLKSTALSRLYCARCLVSRATPPSSCTQSWSLDTVIHASFLTLHRQHSAVSEAMDL